jgi:hypothetical protein
VFVYFSLGDIYHDLRSLTLGAVNRLATHSALNEWLRAVKPFKKFIPSTVMDRYRDNASQLWPWIGFLVTEKEEEFSFARVTSVARGRWKAVRRHLPQQIFIYNRMCHSSLETRILTTLAGHGRRQSSPQIQERGALARIVSAAANLGEEHSAVAARKKILRGDPPQRYPRVHHPATSEKTQQMPRKCELHPAQLLEMSF